MKASDVLEQMLETKRAKEKEYNENWQITGRVMNALWPGGISQITMKKDQFHIVLMIITKLCRYVTSDLEHIDSIHDMGIYCAIAQALTEDGKKVHDADK